MSNDIKDVNAPIENDPKKTQVSLLGEILGSQDLQLPTNAKVDLLSDSFISGTDVVNDQLITSTSIGPVAQEIIKKTPKKPMSTAIFLRIVGAILLVALIFFGAFLAYIVFNPGQASFFIGLGINPGDITLWLRQLVRTIFGVATFILAIVWIVFLFKAILTKKEYKKKKTMSIIFSLFFGTLFFSEITLWAFLEKQINATDYENPNGGVIVYDNEKLISERFKNEAKMSSFDNLIGPLVLKFDLKADSGLVGKILDIEKYELDFDGAKCQGTDSSRVTGVNAQTDQSIICIFDQAKIFKPTGRYEGLDRVTHKSKVISINFRTIQIVGVVDITKPKTYKDKAIKYDASRLSSLGNINWLIEKDNNLVSMSSDPVFSITTKNSAQILCLNVSSGNTCDKLFIIPKTLDSSITGKIVHEQDNENPLEYSFYLKDEVVTNGEVTGYKWVSDGITIGTEKTCTHLFSDYGDARVILFLTDSAGNTTEIQDYFTILQPLKITKSDYSESLLRVIDNSGKSIIDNTYKKTLNAYYISEIVTPMNVQLDATDVKVNNFGYELIKVEWDLNGDGVFEKTGYTTQYEFIEEKRYAFQVRYTFEDKVKKLQSIIIEKMIFEPAKKDISLTLKLSQDSDYAPTVVHVDGSASIPKTGTIAKFMYDFGEGKGPIEGDAIQDYRYNFSGEYVITFIVVRDDGTKQQSSRKIILKDAPKRIVINTSVSSGIVGKSIDFDTNGTIGQIETYSWDFGDGNTSGDSNPSHSYQAKGKYTLKVTVTYADKTVKSTDREIIVNE